MLIFYNINWALHISDFNYLTIHQCGDFRLKTLMVEKLWEHFMKKNYKRLINKN